MGEATYGRKKSPGVHEAHRETNSEAAGLTS